MLSEDWAEGYVSEMEYTSGFYRELSPSYLNLVCLLSGHLPSAYGRPLRYCELGCGNGFSTVLNAATNPRGQFVGIDFNPAHIANARRLAADGGIDNIEYTELSFDQLSARDLPDFDYIALHGVWSWINASNHAAVQQFIKARLTPGGLVYISYNCLPEWGASVPLRRLLYEHVTAGFGPTQERIDRALQFADELAKKGGSYFQRNPTAVNVLKRIAKGPQNYIAHECLVQDFHPSYHADVARAMSEAKLSYVGSADLHHVFGQCYSAELQEMVHRITDPVLRETLRDFCVPTAFRKDVYMRGAPPIPPAQRRALFEQMRFVLTVPRKLLRLKVRVPNGEFQANEEIYSPIADALAEGPRTIGELAALGKTGFREVERACVFLVMSNQAAPVPDPGDKGETSPNAALALNRAIAHRAVYEDRYHALASPVTGNGIPASQMELFVYYAVAEVGAAGGDVAAGKIAKALLPRIETLTVKDQTLTTKKQIAKELPVVVGNIIDEKLALWRMLGAI